MRRSSTFVILLAAALLGAGPALAEEIGEVDLIKNALYLSGQVAVLLDDEARGREIFAELQRRFYPGQPFLADLLVNVDVRPLINLRA